MSGDLANIRVDTAMLIGPPDQIQELTRAANTCVRCGLAYRAQTPGGTPLWLVGAKTPKDCDHELAAPDTDDDQDACAVCGCDGHSCSYDCDCCPEHPQED